jgi:hypothetical protein
MNKYNLVNLITNMQPVPSIYNEGFSQYEDILYLINLTNSLITNQNLGADEITDLQNKKLAFVDYLLDIHNTRKIDDNGNFTGSWCGVDKPVHVEGGIDAVVIAQGEDIVINTNNIKDVMYLESLGFNLWGDANFYNSVTKKWYKDSGFTQLATDNTVALQNLINAFPNRKIRINGGKKFKISNTITISKPIYLEGDGYLASMIVVDGDFPSGQPV